MSTFKEKYIKYKKKYLELKNKMKGGSEADNFKKAIEESKRTALRDNIKRTLQNKIFLNNEGKYVLFKDLSKYEQNTIIDDKIFEKEKEESKKKFAQAIKASKKLEQLRQAQAAQAARVQAAQAARVQAAQAARVQAAQEQEAQQRQLRKIIKELKNLTYTDNSGVEVKWDKLKSELQQQIIDNKMIEIAKRKSKKEAQKLQQRRPAPDGKQKKLPELKSIKFNYIPPDGFCGFRALYNASKNIKIKKNNKVPKHVVHKIRENLDHEFLTFLKDVVIASLEDPKAKKNITSNSDEIKKSLDKWIKDYKKILKKHDNIRELFHENGDPIQLLEKKDAYGIIHWPEIEALKGLESKGYADENILGYLGDILGLNIIMTNDEPRSSKEQPYLTVPNNEFKQERKTILLKNKGCHWEWADLGTKYNSVLSEYINKNFRNKYLKYKKKYLLLKSKLK